MTVRTALAPLVSGTTYRRAVYLLLGGVVLLPYVLLGALFVTMFNDPRAAPGPLVVALAVAVVIAGVPAFLRGTRALEIAAARGLLDVDLPEPSPTRGPARIEWETRLRAALWFVVHLLAGGVLALALLIALPMALVFIIQQFGIGTLSGLRFGPLESRDTVWFTVIGLALLIAIGYAVAGLGALAALMAPVLLGPSQTERIAALEARAGQLAERNRLARELHDSIGHALTVTTLQAAAARRVLDTDPRFADRALLAIEETGRRAMDDLDYVLGVLRERPAGGEPSPHRTLADLDRLLADARATGLDVSADVPASVDELPAAISREGYRIVQEGLTNAARHAGSEPVSLRVAVAAGTLGIELTNPMAGVAPNGRAGRGLAGMRERVDLLGGTLTVGRDGAVWRVAVRLPTDVPR